MSDLLGFDLLFFLKRLWASRLARACISHTKLLFLHFVEEFEVGLNKYSTIYLRATVISHDIFEHSLCFHDLNRLSTFL